MNENSCKQQAWFKVEKQDTETFLRVLAFDTFFTHFFFANAF